MYSKAQICEFTVLQASQLPQLPAYTASVLHHGWFQSAAVQEVYVFLLYWNGKTHAVPATVVHVPPPVVPAEHQPVKPGAPATSAAAPVEESETKTERIQWLLVAPPGGSSRCGFNCQ